MTPALRDLISSGDDGWSQLQEWIAASVRPVELRHGASEHLHVSNAAAYSVLNVLGLPAGVVPVTTLRNGEESDRPRSRDPVERVAAETERRSAGLPVGAQVAARAWREDLVLGAMRAIEVAVRERSGVTFIADPKLFDTAPAPTAS